MRPSNGARPRLAIVASHPVQYHAPLYRELASRLDLTVFFTHHATPADQARAGFGVEFEWDTSLLDGFEHRFLDNVAREPGLHHFAGCDTPGLGTELAHGGFDAVLVQGWHLKAYVQAVRFARQLGIPVMARGDSQLDTPRSALKRAAKALAYPCLLRRFDAALFVGSKSREYWRHYHYPESRLFFSPHCVDNRGFAARAGVNMSAARNGLGINEQEKVLLFAGKLIALKRPADVIEAARRLRESGRNVSVLVAGSGPLQGELEALADRLGVPTRFLGFRNQSEMPVIYAAADLLVLPSSEESWGLVANEALACGTPILLSDRVGAAADLAADGMAGGTYPCGDLEKLASGAAALLASPPARSAMAARIAEYSVEAAAAGIVAATKAVTGKRR
jgi:glycosyltransferase involved in cell wall biosynthesis